VPEILHCVYILKFVLIFEINLFFVKLLKQKRNALLCSTEVEFIYLVQELLLMGYHGTCSEENYLIFYFLIRGFCNIKLFKSISGKSKECIR
jgi:hypothetical protein